MIKQYASLRCVPLLMYACVLIFFPLVHFLYGLRMDAILYSLTIFSFLFALFLVPDFLRFVRKAKRIDEAARGLSIYPQIFPKADGLFERQYQRIIDTLYREIDENAGRLNRAHREQADYYTMWMHQIKTPIFACRLILESGELQKELFAQELFKIERYVEMALQYVRMQELSSDLIIQQCDLKAIAAQCLKKYADLFIYKKLSADIGGADGTVTTDARWLSFILEQLLSNAVKYTDKGGVAVFSVPGGLSVRDTGTGISAQDIARVFEKGYTGLNGRLDGRATGIGLYLAKKAADALNIRLTIESNLGCGTTATLFFPEQTKEIE